MSSKFWSSNSNLPKSEIESDCTLTSLESLREASTPVHTANLSVPSSSFCSEPEESAVSTCSPRADFSLAALAAVFESIFLPFSGFAEDPPSPSPSSPPSSPPASVPSSSSSSSSGSPCSAISFSFFFAARSAFFRSASAFFSSFVSFFSKSCTSPLFIPPKTPMPLLAMRCISSSVISESSAFFMANAASLAARSFFGMVPYWRRAL